MEENNEEGFQRDFFGFLGHEILGWSDADCWVCAWKEINQRFGKVGLGVVCESEPSDGHQPCRRSDETVVFVSFQYHLVLGFTQTDCQPCAWKELLSLYPEGMLAVKVPCRLEDLARRCVKRIRDKEVLK